MNTQKKLKLMAEIEHRNNERIRKMISEGNKNESAFHPHAAYHCSSNNGETEESQSPEAEHTNLPIKKEPRK